MRRRKLADTVTNNGSLNTLTPYTLTIAGKSYNAITADMAIGGSTNAIIHLVAMAGRAGIKLPLEQFDAISQRTAPNAVNAAVIG